jgi:hypothetical protein
MADVRQNEQRVSLFTDDGLATNLSPAAGTSAPNGVSVQGVSGGVPIPVSTTDTYPATQNITVIDSGTTSVAGFNNQTITTGTPTAGSAATFALNGINTVAIQTSGTWTGTLRLEGSMDGGTTYTGKFSRLPGTSYPGVTTFTANCMVLANLSGYTHLRVRATAAMTGTAVIKVSESINSHTVDILNPIRLVDSTTNSTATVKAASTAPAAADTSLVVGLSPNGANIGSILTGPNVGQTTSNTSAIQLTASSIPAFNGMLIQAISTNAASVFIGGSGVTTSTGFELQAGQAVPFTAANINLLYVIGSNNTDKVCWNVL